MLINRFYILHAHLMLFVSTVHRPCKQRRLPERPEAMGSTEKEGERDEKKDGESEERVSSPLRWASPTHSLTNQTQQQEPSDWPGQLPLAASLVDPETSPNTISLFCYIRRSQEGFSTKVNCQADSWWSSPAGGKTSIRCVCVRVFIPCFFS